MKIIQNNLKMLGFAPISIDGIFGSETEFAVKKLQESYDLSADGIVEESGDFDWCTVFNF